MELNKLKTELTRKELLQLHDCVIFPNLGGFVAQYCPANFDEKKSVLSPPHKQILFNKNLISFNQYFYSNFKGNKLPNLLFTKPSKFPYTL